MGHIMAEKTAQEIQIYPQHATQVPAQVTNKDATSSAQLQVLTQAASQMGGLFYYSGLHLE